MSYYLYIKSRCAGQHAGLSGDFPWNTEPVCPSATKA